jgi:hypothetical protein
MPKFELSFLVWFILLSNEWIFLRASGPDNSRATAVGSCKSGREPACSSNGWTDPTISNALKFIDGYTDQTYAKMRDDASRTEAYRRAITVHAKGRVVLDIGTGALALLAIMAAEAGARKVSFEKGKKVRHRF